MDLHTFMEQVSDVRYDSVWGGVMRDTKALEYAIPRGVPWGLQRPQAMDGELTDWDTEGGRWAIEVAVLHDLIIR